MRRLRETAGTGDGGAVVLKRADECVDRCQFGGLRRRRRAGADCNGGADDRLENFQFDRLCPDDERDDTLAVRQIALENLRLAAMRDFDELSPFGRVVESRIRLSRGRPDAREAVEVAVDDVQLLIVMCVRARVARRAVGITRVIHAGAQVGVVEIFVLVVETERVAHFLADDELSPTRCVVLSLVEGTCR